jgi:CHAT domain-containing protein/tetratricopeptide (TPR) repeat protein
MKTMLPPLLAAVSLVVVFCDKAPQTAPASPLKQEIHHSEAAAALRKRVEYFTIEENYDSVLAYARRGAEIAERENDWDEWSKAQLHIVYALYDLEKFDEAAASFGSIESTGGEKIPADSSFWGDYFNIAGAISNELGDYEKAIHYGNLEINFFDKKHNLDRLALASNNTGSYYLGRGDYDRALDCTESALGIYLSAPDTNAANLAWTYDNLSKIWYRKKEFPKAIDNARKALELLEHHVEGEKAKDLVITFNDLANAYIETQKYDTAINYLQKALRIFESNKGAGKIESTWHNVGNALRLSGKYDEATHYLKLALEKYGPSHPNLGKACRHMAYIAHNKGDYREALAWQQKAFSALTSDPFPHENMLANPPARRVKAYFDFLMTLRDKSETLRKLAEKESNPTFLEAAFGTLDLAAGVLDSMRKEYQEGSREFWNREARPIMENAIELAFQLYQNTGDQHYLEQAFRYAEKSKALLLAEALRESAAKRQAGIQKTLLQEEKDLKIAIAFYKSQIIMEEQKSDADAGKIARWKNEYLRKNRAYENLLDTLETAYPEYYKIKYQDSVPTPAAVRQWLPANGALFEYFRGDKNIYAFYVDKKTFLGFKITTDDDYTLRLTRLLEQLHNRNLVYEEGLGAEAIAKFAENAHGLYRLLLSPVGKMPEKLIVIPDGDLAYLPFELLLTESSAPATGYSQLPYLLLRTATRYEYSAGLAIRPSPPQQPRTYFAGYAPSYENTSPTSPTRDDNSQCRTTELSDLPALSNNQKEVEEIAKILSGKAYTSVTATEEIFKQNADQPRILHLAMHGFLNDCNPLLSGLAFSLESINKSPQDSLSDEHDGLLRTYEIYNLKINADLAVLSACNTGSGQLSKGEGVMSLARAFKYAGCPNVVMSFWQAEDHSTAQIMKEFYRQLQQGAGKDQALRQAKLAYLKDSKLDHPYFWGAFVLIGDDKSLPRNTPWTLYIAAGLVVAVLFGAGFYFWKHKNKSKSQ